MFVKSLLITPHPLLYSHSRWFCVSGGTLTDSMGQEIWIHSLYTCRTWDQWHIQVKTYFSDRWNYRCGFWEWVRTRERNQTAFHIEVIIKVEPWMKPWGQSIAREEKVSMERILDTARGRNKRQRSKLKLTEARWDQKTTCIEPRRKGL